MHLIDGLYLTPTNYNYGMQQDDLKMFEDSNCYFTRDQMHYFSVFVNYRFLDSFRQRLTDNDFWEQYCRDL